MASVSYDMSQEEEEASGTPNMMKRGIMGWNR